jgi:4-hydroxybenzoate polyprenyltransferase
MDSPDDFIDRSNPAAIEEELKRKTPRTPVGQIVRFIFAFLFLFCLYAIILGFMRPPSVFYLVGLVLVVIASYRFAMKE